MSATDLAVLLLAVAVPPGIALAARGSEGRIAIGLAAQAVLLVLAAAVLAYAVHMRGVGLPAFGLGPPTRATLLVGAGLASLIVLVVGPLLSKALVVIGAPAFDAGLSRLARYPTWYLALAVLVGAAAEEVLYRGFAFPLLRVATGSAIVAGMAITSLFVLAHCPLWGARAALAIGLASAPLLGAFALTNDLWANILAHALIDLAGIVAPLSARRRARDGAIALAATRGLRRGPPR